MVGDPFKEEAFRQMAGLKAPQGDNIFTKSRLRGGGVARPKPPAKPEDVGDEETIEPIQEPEKQKTSDVLLSNGRWLLPQGRYGQPVEASVDVVLPADLSHLTRVVFTVHELLPDGRRVERFKDEAHVKDGKAVCALTMPEPQAVDGKVPEKAYFLFAAKHAKSEEHQGPRLEVVPGPPKIGFESVLYYSPVREEYFHFETREEFETLQEEIEKLKNTQGMSRKALEQEAASRQKKLEELAGHAEELFDEGATIGEADGVLEEILLVRGNPRWGNAKSWVYIRSHTRKNQTQVKGHWRKESDKKIKDNLEDLLKKAPGNKESSPLLSGDISQKLFEVKPKAGQPLMWYRKEKRGEIAGKSFEFTKEAAICRFAYGFEGEATANWKERKIGLGATGNLTYGLLEGSMQGRIPCPEDGINLLAFLQEVKGINQFLKQNRKCLVRVNVILGAQVFAGLSVAAALSLPHIDLSKAKPGKKTEKKANLGGTGSGVLGIQCSESLAVVPEWSQTHNPPKFEALGQAQAEIGATVGIAGEGRMEIAYEKGRFRFKLGAGVALGFGPRGGISFDVALEEGWKMVGHLLKSVDYRYVAEISTDAFEAYKNYAFTLMTKGKQALVEGVVLTIEVIDKFKPWLEVAKQSINDVKRALLESSSYELTLSNVPPEALGQALITIMLTRDEEDFQPIFWILRSTVNTRAGGGQSGTANHKLKWTLRSVSEVIIPEDENDPTYEEKKESALQSGIKRIEDFGLGIGYVDKQGNPQERNADFLRKFHDLLHKNGVR